ncbi:hypothetical protein ACFSRY_15870 [Pontibacter locisalis]|uniref:Uncharacterized protein n=1 Tax=Pontibacter locisalis TaxID=1719035 RepID=A0ABW5INZ0_9BACT
MNRNESDRYGSNQQSGYQTHRSERFRHPERSNDYRFDNYGSSARGGYGDEGHSGTWGNQGNEMGGSRNVSNRGMDDTYSTSRNYGNMGSYGGAQGFGSARGGSPSQRQDDSGSAYRYVSGMGSPMSRNRDQESGRSRSYGYQSDYDSHGSGFKHDANPDLYGSDTSRRFQGSDQGSYHFDRNRDQSRSGYSSGSSYSGRYGSDRDRSDRDSTSRSSYSSGSSYSSDRDRDNYGSSNYGGSQGSYMGSGYNRTSDRDYGSGNYGSMGSYDRGSSSMSYGEPYGRSSNSSYPNPTYARDTENTRIQHPDSDYDYDPNHSFDTNKDKNYIASRNRNRSFDRDRERGSDRF